MNGHELAQAWKDPDRGGDASDAEHPSGEIALDYSGGGDVVVNATEYLATFGCSCHGGPTNWAGTCACTYLLNCYNTLADGCSTNGC